MGHSFKKCPEQSVPVLQFLDLKLLLWPNSSTSLFKGHLLVIMISAFLYSVMLGIRTQPLVWCDSVDVGDQWVAPGRVSPEVSRSLSLRGSPAAGHLLPTFPSLFISPWQFIPLPVKAPPLPSPHFLLSSAEFGTISLILSPIPATQAKACWDDPFIPPPSRLCDIQLQGPP